MLGIKMEKLKISDIKEGDFIKKEASIYLIKYFNKTDKRYKLDYYFRSTKKMSGVLHINGSREIYEHDLTRIKTPTKEEIEILKNKIVKEYPDFTFNSSWLENYQKPDIQSEKECIDFLKARGFLIFKKI
jgi:hypothetical protein